MTQSVILITQEEFDRLVDERVEKKLESFRESINQTQSEEKYDSKEETRKRLGVSMPTLDDGVRRGLFPAYRFGSRVLFKRSEVDAALVQIKSDKFYNSKA